MRRADQLAKFRTVGQTVSPERAIVLLYERMGRDLAQARIAIANGDTEARHNALVHAQEIVAELAYAVRPDLCDGADRLLSIYDYLLNLLVRANVESNVPAIDEAAALVAKLTAAWQEAYVEVAAETLAADQPTPQPAPTEHLTA